MIAQISLVSFAVKLEASLFGVDGVVVVSSMTMVVAAERAGLQMSN